VLGLVIGTISTTWTRAIEPQTGKNVFAGLNVGVPLFGAIDVGLRRARCRCSTATYSSQWGLSRRAPGLHVVLTDDPRVDEAGDESIRSGTMRRSMTGNIEQRRLYCYIGMALDAVAGMSRDPIDGDAEAVLARLYLRRMASVFGEPVDARGADAKSLDEIVARLDEFRRWRADDILTVRFDKIEVGTGGDPQDPSLDHRRFDGEKDLGIEAFATYLPIHFFPEGHRKKGKPGWGIYVSEAGVRHVARVIEQRFVQSYGAPCEDDQSSFHRIAFEVLLRHEMEHFKVESFALSAEMQQRRPLYVPYLMKVYASTYPFAFCLEESLANATVLNSTVIKKHLFKLYPDKPKDWRDILAKSLFDGQPDAYSNYEFKRPWHREKDQARAALTKYTDRPRRDAMNYLCNQIVTGQPLPPDGLLPFYAFPPDNFFLRAESLVPVYILNDLPEDLSFIHYPTPTWTDWEWFLRQMDFRQTRKGKGDHVVWERPGFEMITNNYHGKELDRNSFRSALLTLGITRREFDLAWIPMQKKKANI